MSDYAQFIQKSLNKERKSTILINIDISSKSSFLRADYVKRLL